MNEKQKTKKIDFITFVLTERIERTEQNSNFGKKIILFTPVESHLI